MSKKKIAITLDRDALAMIDSMVAEGLFSNRSKVIQEAVQDKLEDLQKLRLYKAVGQLNPAHEQQLADHIGR